MDTQNNYSDARIDAFFDGIDKTLEQVTAALQEANMDVDLSSARKSVREAGKTVSQSVHRIKSTPMAAGQGVLSMLLSFIKRLLSALFGARRPIAPPPIADEDLPFVEDERPLRSEPDLQIPTSGDETVDSVLQFQQTQIAVVEDCATVLFRQRPQTAMQLEEICRIYRCILYALARRPEVLPKLQRFFGYYVPTLKKFCAAYVELTGQAQTTAAPTAEKTMHELESAFASLEQAFRKKVDELYGAVELDISSDISVLEAMLQKDGLA